MLRCKHFCMLYGGSFVHCQSHLETVVAFGVKARMDTKSRTPADCPRICFLSTVKFFFRQ